MVLFNKLKNTFKRYSRDEEGAFSIIWGVSALAFLAVMGAALDFTLLSSANARAQSVADTAALSAAIYVRDNGMIPENRNKGLIGTYNAAELGYNFKNWVIDGGNGVNINVVYDEANKKAIVTASGSTRPLFMQVFGHEKLDFSSESVVNFEDKQPLDPASVVMVLDNSGSMFFDDTPLDSDGNRVAGTQRRIDGLTTSVDNFMTQLDTLVGEQDGSTGAPRVLRTGFMTFSDRILRTVPMEWGTVPVGTMVPDGATDSSPPLVDANTWLNINEPPIHAAENPGKPPLKYLIMMTDGRNTVGTQQWVARDGTETWRAWLQIGTTFSDDFRVVDAFVPGGDCRVRGGYPRERYVFVNPNGSVFDGFTSLRVECRVEVPEFDWVLRFQEDMPTEPGVWEEGEEDITSNINTRRQCDILQAAGVEIFTIAYALTPGRYRTNDWEFGDPRGRPRPSVVETSQDASNNARSILNYCASRSENFITADDTNALTAAFERIGNTIVKEIIRIDS